MKHNARLPRTAGLRTLSELSASLTKAGLDPSRIEQRAQLIAKARGLEGKRKRDEEMDIDEEGEDEENGGSGEGGDWMDVDGEEGDERSSPKRRKSNTGTAVTAAGKHAPRTNRQMAGMRDQSQVSKAVRLRNLGQRERNMHAKAGESDRAIRVKMVSRRDQKERAKSRFCSPRPTFSRSTCFLGNGRRERHRDDEGFLSLSLSHTLFILSSLSSARPVVVCFLFSLHFLSSHSTHSRWFTSRDSTVPCVLGMRYRELIYMSRDHTPGIYETS